MCVATWRKLAWHAFSSLWLPFHKLLCLLQHLFIFGIVCQFVSGVFSHHAPTQLLPDRNMLALLPLRNQLSTSIQGFADVIKCWWRTWFRQVSLHLNKRLIKVHVECCLFLVALPTMIGHLGYYHGNKMTRISYKWVNSWLLGYYRKHPWWSMVMPLGLQPLGGNIDHLRCLT